MHALFPAVQGPTSLCMGVCPTKQLSVYIVWLQDKCSQGRAWEWGCPAYKTNGDMQLDYVELCQVTEAIHAQCSYIRSHACQMYCVIVILLSATYSILWRFRVSALQYLISSWTLLVSEPGETLVLLLPAADVLMKVEHWLPLVVEALRQSKQVLPCTHSTERYDASWWRSNKTSFSICKVVVAESSIQLVLKPSMSPRL